MCFDSMSAYVVRERENTLESNLQSVELVPHDLSFEGRCHGMVSVHYCIHGRLTVPVYSQRVFNQDLRASCMRKIESLSYLAVCAQLGLVRCLDDMS